MQCTTYHGALLFARSKARRRHICTANGFYLFDATKFWLKQQLCVTNKITIIYSLLGIVSSRAAHIICYLVKIANNLVEKPQAL